MLENNLKGIPKLFLLLLSLIMCFSLAFATPSLAFAGTTGSGGGGDGAGGGGKFAWTNMSANGRYSIDDTPANFLTQTSNGGAGGVYGDTTFGPNIYGNTYWAAYVAWVGSENGGTNHYDGWVSRWDIGGSGSKPNINGNWRMNWPLNDFFIYNQEYLPDGMTFERNSGTTGTYNSCIFWRTHQQDWLNGVWIDENKLYVDQIYTNKRTKIVKYENPYGDPNGGGDPDGTEFDDSAKTPEWKYNNGKEQGTYHGITPPTGDNSHNYTNKISIKVQVITKKITITCLNKDKPGSFAEAEQIAENFKNTGVIDSKYQGNPNNKKNPSIEYIAGPIQTLEKEITYKGEIPDNPQTKYRPFNLNKNTNNSTSGNSVDEQSYAVTGENGLTPDFGTSTNFIKGYVNNGQNITNNEALNALDINNDTDFLVKFNNGSYGLDIYDWFTAPTPLSEGTWEYSGDQYANGRVGDMTNVNSNESAGIYRFNLKLNTSISNSDKAVSSNQGDTASLTYEGREEKTASESQEFSTNNDPDNGFRGGNFGARFSLVGKYTTDNEIETTNKLYWIARYDQARFYEYGVEYKGTFNTTGISDPYLVSPNKDPKPTVNGTHFSTNGTTQRGLYVGCAQKTYDQPILTGTWDVKTLAGDTRN